MKENVLMLLKKNKLLNMISFIRDEINRLISFSNRNNKDYGNYLNNSHWDIFHSASNKNETILMMKKSTRMTTILSNTNGCGVSRKIDRVTIPMNRIILSTTTDFDHSDTICQFNH
jgi:hypothetical protein